jgi:EAL domain-containing protein (putative c-di-GMP-specific phosphodiesterase class I)
MAFKLSSGFSADIIFVIILAIVSVGFVVFLYKSIKKERIQYAEIVKKEKLNIKDMKEFIEKRISHGKRSQFALYQIEIYDGDMLQNNLGDVQFKNFIGELLLRISGVVPDAQVYTENNSIYLYVKNLSNAQQLEYFARLILEQTKKPFTIVGSLKIDIDVNICAAIFPQSGRKYGEFMHNLELAMIASKRMGLNTFKIYDKQLSNEQTDEYKYYKEIKEAINNKDFTLFYQPIVDINTNAIIGAESLLRWNHKTMGILPPSKFLDILEQSGDIYWVGLWAFEQLIKQYHQIKVKFPDIKLMFTMNLSSKQLLNPSLANEFKRLLLKHRADAADFCMEIVEFAMFDKMDIVQDNIIKLGQMGLKIAIDDYGLDFSTLAALDKLPIDVIKFNKEFFTKSDGFFTQNLIETLNKYATQKNMTIIAQGVEDEAFVQRIKKLNIKYAQGYYYYKPRSFEELILSIKSDISANEA